MKMRKWKKPIVMLAMALCVGMTIPTNVPVVNAAEEDLDDFGDGEVIADGYITKAKTCYVVGDTLDTDDILLQVYDYSDGSIKTYSGKDIEIHGLDEVDMDTPGCYLLTASVKGVEGTLSWDEVSINVYAQDEPDMDLQSSDYSLNVSKKKTVYHVGDKLDIDDLEVVAEPGETTYDSRRVMTRKEYVVDQSSVDMSADGSYNLKIRSKEPITVGDMLRYPENYVPIRVYGIPETPSEPDEPEQPTAPEQPGASQQPTTPTQPTAPTQPVPTQSAVSQPADLTPVSDSTDLLPGKVSGLKVKALGGKKISIKWKDSANAWSYQIQISTKKNFAKAKKKETYNHSLAWKKLKKGKTYYVRVRATAIDGYSAWSAAKKVKVK
ncbi:MAG: fibronectin type III domain-containing protein [Clostridiales bacterium]|nr:fibronectin type III domain-containing protein [Clostridiales bacterium]